MKYEELYQKIARAGGIYDTRKYRYIIDQEMNGEIVIKRTLIENLDTVAMLRRDAWELVAKKANK